MSWAVFAAVATVVMVAGFVQGTTGVGFALIVAPILALLAPDLVPVSLLMLMLPLNVYVAWREWGALDRSGATWITAGRFLGTFGGLWLLTALRSSLLNSLIGAITILAAIATLVAPSFTPDRRALVAAGVITGVTETATGIGGPPLAMVYQHQGAATLRSTLAFCFLVGRVDDWRGGDRRRISVAAPFGSRCPTSHAMAPFPVAAHRTGHADRPHPALGQDNMLLPTEGRVCR